MTFYNIIYGILFIAACRQVLVMSLSVEVWTAATIAVVVFNDALNTSEVLETEGAPDYTMPMKILDLFCFLLLSAALVALSSGGDTPFGEVTTPHWLSHAPSWMPWLLVTVYWVLLLEWNRRAGVYESGWPRALKRYSRFLVIPPAVMTIVTAIVKEPGDVPLVLRILVFGLLAVYFLVLKPWVGRPMGPRTNGRSPLAWMPFPAGPNGFFRAPVLLSGSSESLLIDGGFTLADGRALAEAIKPRGKSLSTVYISQSDPDYYFGLRPIKDAFPGARIIAAKATVDAIAATVEGKVKAWLPTLQGNGPQTPADVVIPEAADVVSFKLGGHLIEIVDAAGLPNRRYVWVPSLQAVFGGVLIFSGVHVWTADTANAAARAAWIKALDTIAGRNPKIVVPGHMTATAGTDGSAIAFTRQYLVDFEKELGKAADSNALIGAMKRLYPNAGMDVALDIGAKVAKGEMSWP